MNQPLDFEKLKSKCVKILDENKYISVATAQDGRVRVRVVDYANVDLSIGFLTWVHSLKMEHIRHNPQIALCINNLQIEGRAVMTGHPGLESNRLFIERFQERNPNPYRNFIQRDDVTTIMVEPALMIVMTYADKHLYSDHLDLIQQTATRVVLSSWDAEL